MAKFPLHEEDHSSIFWWLAATWFVARQVCSTWVVKRSTLFSTHSFCTIMLQNKLHVFVASFTVLWAFYSAEVSLCCREAGETEKDGARGTMEKKKPLPSSHRPPARFLFFDYCYFYWDTLYPSEASAEESVPWVNNAFTLITCLNRGAFCLRMCCTERLL